MMGMKQLPLAIGLDAAPDFDSFASGANQATVVTLKGLLTQLGAPSAPVYLYGPSGTGKTHLLNALAHDLQLRGGRSGFFRASHPLPWSFDEGWSMILLDDADQLDPLRQHAAFTLFVEAYTHGVQMVSAGRLPPVDLPVREDLRTRFGWGLVFALQPLPEAEVRQVLAHEALRRGVPLGDEVLDYLLTRFARDLGSLMRLLDRLDRFSLAQGRAVTVPLLKKMLTEEESSSS